MIFLNILQKLQNSNLIQKLPKKKVNYLLQKHFQDKNRIHFLRSKLKYGKVLFQLEYQYYKGKYLINTVYKPVLINQAPETNIKHSYDGILDSISAKKDFWSFLLYTILLYFTITYVYVETYNYIYVDLGNNPKFLCFKSTISRINSNYFDQILLNDPIYDLIGNRDLCPNSDFLVFLSGCSKSNLTKDGDFFLNVINSVLGLKTNIYNE